MTLWSIAIVSLGLLEIEAWSESVGMAELQVKTQFTVVCTDSDSSLL